MEKMTDVMLDLETLGKTPSAVILQIGLVAFNRNEPFLPAIHAGWHPRIEEQIEDGRVIDESTLVWWGGSQTEGFKAQMEADRVPHYVIVEQIEAWMEEHVAEGAYWWAKSTPFDMPMMAGYIGTELWDFRKAHEMRTLQAVVPKEHREYVLELDGRPVVGHDAVDDARVQAIQVQEMWSYLKTRIDGWQ